MPRTRLVMLSLALAALHGCGAAPAPTASMPFSGPAGAPVAVAARPAFQFYAYERLSPEQRRVLEASQLSLGAGAQMASFGGRALYDHLVSHDPKAIANFLNQTAVLAATRFANGQSALDYVKAIDGLKINHVYAQVDPALYEAVKALSAPKHRPDVAYVGPEDSSMLHGKYDTSFRENRPYTSQQLAFSAQDGFTRVDIDLDEENPFAGSRVALAKHAIRVIKHEILRKWPGTQYGENSEPDYFYHALTRSPLNPDGMMPMPKPNEAIVGGHAVHAVGYDDAKQALIVRNSWGKAWGDQGHFYMPYAFVADKEKAMEFWTAQ